MINYLLLYSFFSNKLFGILLEMYQTIDGTYNRGFNLYKEPYSPYNEFLNPSTIKAKDIEMFLHSLNAALL